MLQRLSDVTEVSSGALLLHAVLYEAKTSHFDFLWIEQVIENHSKQQERQRQDDTADFGHKEEDTQEDGAEEEDENEEDDDTRVEEGDAVSPDASFASQSSPYPDSRLVKSHSEAPIGSPRG